MDKLEREKAEESDQKLKQLGFSMDEVSSFIARAEPTAELGSILNNLAARGLKDFVRIDYHVIRGLAYYTGVVFEAFDCKGEFRAIAGGGRYDNLLKLISGGKVNLPALGFGMGDVVLLELLKARSLLPKLSAAIDVFCLIEDESLRDATLKAVSELRTRGLTVDYSLAPAKSDKQFKRAQELSAAKTLKLERGATGELTAKIRDLRSREEQTIPADAISTVSWQPM